MLLSDKQIESMGIITPFHSSQISERENPQMVGIVSPPVISYGVSSYGYDVTIGRDVKIFTNANGVVVDPKRFNKASFFTAELIKEWGYGTHFILPPHSFALATTVEYFRMPRNVEGVMTVKSTYARCGVWSPTTVLEAGWEGNITLEISNATPLPVRIYINEGIAQVLFFQGTDDCKVSYADRNGKYQGQTGVTLPR